MPNKITQTIEKHPVITSLILGGAGLGIALILAKRASGSSSSNTPTNVCTDASGNPVDCSTGQPLSGATVSPALSSTDLQAMLQDMENQILNWEQTFGQNSTSNSGSSNPAPIPPGPTTGGNSNSTGGITTNAVPASVPANIISTIKNTFGPHPPQPGPTQTHKQSLLSLLTNSVFRTTKPETTQQLASFFGLQNGWADIAYNPHNKFLLSQAFAQHGNNMIPAGTAVWIPTTRIEA